MDNQQRSDLDAIHRVCDLNNEHVVEFDLITNYNELKAKFNAKVVLIDKAGAVQVETGITHPASQDVKQKMVDVIEKYFLIAKAKAFLLGNNDLVKLFTFAPSTIFYATKTKAMYLATNKRKALDDNKDVLGNITPEIMAEIDNAISAYDKIKDAPTEAIHTKATASDQLPGFITDAFEIIDLMYGLVYSFYNSTNQDLVSKYEKEKQSIKTGIHTTSVTFDCVTDGDNALINQFTINDKLKNKLAQSDDKGIVQIDHHRSGKHHFNVSAAGCVDVDFEAEIKRGTNNHFTIHLKKKE